MFWISTKGIVSLYSFLWFNSHNVVVDEPGININIVMLKDDQATSIDSLTQSFATRIKDIYGRLSLQGFLL
jgi:hypothetical protein